MDDKFVVDATMAGGRARFINHSCGPNCMSKIITVDGRKVSTVILYTINRLLNRYKRNLAKAELLRNSVFAKFHHYQIFWTILRHGQNGF